MWLSRVRYHTKVLRDSDERLCEHELHAESELASGAGAVPLQMKFVKTRGVDHESLLWGEGFFFSNGAIIL